MMNISRQGGFAWGFITRSVTRALPTQDLKGKKQVETRKGNVTIFYLGGDCFMVQ